jgi:hypothetical protein
VHEPRHVLLPYIELGLLRVGDILYMAGGSKSCRVLQSGAVQSLVVRAERD